MFCRKCGKEIQDDSMFCNSCGVKVGIVENAQEEQQFVFHQEAWPKPLVVIDKDLRFFDTFLLYKEKKYLYCNIKSLNFSRFVYSVNLVPCANETGLHVIFDNEEEVLYQINRSLTRGDTSKLLEQAYMFLQKSTFNLRSNKLINSLNKNGFIVFGTPRIRLYQDGTVENENGRRLKICKSNKSLRIGFGSTNHRFTDPHEIRISDKPRPYLQFDCFESKNTITFHLYDNMDVIRALLKYFIER